MSGSVSLDSYQMEVSSEEGPIPHKEVKYDRQLRLWGDGGQRSLENAHVCLLNASATGTEILKSLVLPGVGSFTIIDGNKVSGEDAGNNFFLDGDSVGKSRGEVSCQFLKEMNSDVKGSWIDETPEQFLENNLSILNSCSLVIGTSLTEKTAVLIGDYLWNNSIPFINVKSYGMLGFIRIVVKEHTVVETHTDNSLPDMRLDRLFPSAEEFVEEIDLESLDHQEHSHIPYLVLLLKAIEKWREQHAPSQPHRFPSAYADKKVVKQILQKMRRPDDKGRIDEQNFQEAIEAVNKCIHETQVPTDIGKLLENKHAINANIQETKNLKFWVLCGALRKFVGREGCLPLQGSLPDMTADSARYVKLQDIYHTKAKEDAQTLYRFVQDILKKTGELEVNITLEETEVFCRNAGHLGLINGRSLRAEVEAPNVEEMRTHLEMDNPNMGRYVLLRAAEKFCAAKERYPGTNGVPEDLDAFDLQNRVEILGKEWKLSAEVLSRVKKEYVEEMCRYGAAELHPVAAFIGGIVAQESIKLITKQYIPLNNTLVFDGHTGSASVFTL